MGLSEVIFRHQLLRLQRDDLRRARRAAAIPRSVKHAEVSEALKDILRAAIADLHQLPATPAPEDELIPVTVSALAPFGLGRARVIAALDSGQLTTPITSKQRRMAYKRELLEWQRAGGLPPKLAIKSKESNEFERRVRQGKLSRG